MTCCSSSRPVSLDVGRPSLRLARWPVVGHDQPAKHGSAARTRRLSKRCLTPPAPVSVPSLCTLVLSTLVPPSPRPFFAAARHLSPHLPILSSQRPFCSILLPTLCGGPTLDYVRPSGAASTNVWCTSAANRAPLPTPSLLGDRLHAGDLQCDWRRRGAALPRRIIVQGQGQRTADLVVGDDDSQPAEARQLALVEAVVLSFHHHWSDFRRPSPAAPPPRTGHTCEHRRMASPIIFPQQCCEYTLQQQMANCFSVRRMQ